MGDNIDHEIKARVQTKQHGNRSLHWTHQYAMLEKVSDPKLQESSPTKNVADLQFEEVLPDITTQSNLVCQWAVLVSRVITKYIPAFRPYQKYAIYHIPHLHSKEMATKSEMVSYIEF